MDKFWIIYTGPQCATYFEIGSPRMYKTRRKAEIAAVKKSRGGGGIECVILEAIKSCCPVQPEIEWQACETES